MENEVLNQEPVETEENLFDGLDFEEDTPVESEETEQADSTETAEPFLRIKYNKEDVDLTQEKAIELSQKGMNYDKMYEKYNSLNDVLSDLAGRNNMNVDDFINNLIEVQRQTEMANEMDTLNSDPRYAGTSEEVLRELAEARIAERFNYQKQQAINQEQQRASAYDAEADRQIEVFKKEYPNVDIHTIGEDVLQYVKEGYTLTEAYTKWARGQAEKNKPVEKANALNKSNQEKSLGSLTNAGANEGDNDFFAGMDSI